MQESEDLPGAGDIRAVFLEQAEFELGLQREQVLKGREDREGGEICTLIPEGPGQ